MKLIQYQPDPSQQGSALIAALIVSFLLGSMAAAMLLFEISAVGESRSAQDSARAILLAESGAADLLAQFHAAAEDPLVEDPTVGVGSEMNPQQLGTGSYWVDVVTTGEIVTLTAYGQSGVQRRALEVTLNAPTGGVYANAVYAGNKTDDPTYQIRFGGMNGQADTITGDIYSGGDVEFWGEATNPDGSVRAHGAIDGIAGEENVSQDPPDLTAMAYETSNDVDVWDEFRTGGASYQGDAAGGRAWQLPESNPAHIFRLNPSDRYANTSSTAKNDYFLEDPYEPPSLDPNSDGSAPYPITLSGQDGNPGVSGSDKVYFIDGNLWIHNYMTYSLAFQNLAGENVNVTFVVKGNIYYSDNIFYEDSVNDSVAFIALEDENEPDSGNIYFGDPTFGTLEVMEAFMYADNNFHDNNLNSSGSAEVVVNGNMTAGNHVDINRDWGNQHSRLTVNFDDRIQTGAIVPPGLPSWAGNTGNGPTGGYTVTSWREVSAKP
jgi:hypothetical protein